MTKTATAPPRRQTRALLCRRGCRRLAQVPRSFRCSITNHVILPTVFTTAIIIVALLCLPAPGVHAFKLSSSSSPSDSQDDDPLTQADLATRVQSSMDIHLGDPFVNVPCDSDRCNDSPRKKSAIKLSTTSTVIRPTSVSALARQVQATISPTAPPPSQSSTPSAPPNMPPAPFLLPPPSPLPPPPPSPPPPPPFPFPPPLPPPSPPPPPVPPSPPPSPPSPPVPPSPPPRPPGPPSPPPKPPGPPPPPRPPPVPRVPPSPSSPPPPTPPPSPSPQSPPPTPPSPSPPQSPPPPPPQLPSPSPSPPLSSPPPRPLPLSSPPPPLLPPPPPSPPPSPPPRTPLSLGASPPRPSPIPPPISPPPPPPSSIINDRPPPLPRPPPRPLMPLPPPKLRRPAPPRPPYSPPKPIPPPRPYNKTPRPPWPPPPPMASRPPPRQRSIPSGVPVVSFNISFPNARRGNNSFSKLLENFQSAMSIITQIQEPQSFQVSLNSEKPISFSCTVVFPSNWRTYAVGGDTSTRTTKTVDVYMLFKDGLEVPAAFFKYANIYPWLNTTGLSVNITRDEYPLDDSPGSSSSASGGGKVLLPPIDLPFSNTPASFTSTSSADTSSPSSSSSSNYANASPPINMTALGVDNQEPPVIMLQGNTLYKWPASSSSLFVEPPVIALDSIDSNNIKTSRAYSFCLLPRTGVDGLVFSDQGTGDLDVSASGLLCSYVPSLDSTQPNRAGEAYMIEYSAVNSRNISAIPKRLLVIFTDPCQSSGESWCFDLKRCSVAGQCIALDLPSIGLGSASGKSNPLGGGADAAGGSNLGTGSINAPIQTTQSPFKSTLLAEDKFPPRIILEGSGRTGRDTEGRPFMLDDVPYGSKWIHPGATALDVDENGVTVYISSRIQSFGVAAVDTSIVTPPNKQYSFWVQYTVSDAAGNEATPAWRLIRVVCVSPEVYCTSIDEITGDTFGRCTVNGICMGASNISSANTIPGSSGVSSIRGTPGISTGSGSTSTSSTSSTRTSSTSTSTSTSSTRTSSTSTSTSSSSTTTTTSSSTGSSTGSSVASSSNIEINFEYISVQLESEVEPRSEPESPMMVLRGPRFVELQQNETYDRCPLSASFTAVCDRGARAEDPREGNLDRSVLVCGQRFIPADGQAPVPVLLACGIRHLQPDLHSRKLRRGFRVHLEADYFPGGVPGGREIVQQQGILLHRRRL
ncbi:hypothetical protein Vafri_14181 [Volvox africanus]|uniref:Pherophorin domain-containing protein n=1 Tax=Volvox africanus TaxID=51714 RepID=A0A8J4BDK7_9CHLO|nr:hypothetical protein Vafri_14181 [Volvox africanus]